ncbi:class I SAM-dependent DNA methyltransferase [Hymenobacter sp. BT175]|uniref:class I SAM-dependent DNA methyltransferase n=1 Tax=Hymenobacter TaxID=89966 RepID=UPI001651A2AC|nr:MULTISPECIES: class I SAM-dependent DNA methyltransferase [Hymenobacter]MBC6700262.1 class I SAM-dependent DNA methyltransferase [Hymenobacter sp. BT190]MCC2548722.1 class I SAM-dependent DNA methyltransferase [Hymenobacter translucens]
MTYSDFAARWLRSGGAERANYQAFLHELCALLGVEPPQPSGELASQDAYVYERAVTFQDGAKKSTGRLDLYKRGCFVLETKQGTNSPDDQQRADAADAAALGQAPQERRRRGHAVRGTRKWDLMMTEARNQALRYVQALPAQEPRPPFVIVADVGHCFDLYANFAGTAEGFTQFLDLLTGIPGYKPTLPAGGGTEAFRIPLTALEDEVVRQRLALLFTDPQQLDPSRRAAQVTRQLAAHLAELSKQLEAAGHASEAVAQFLMRCLFTMFAEDVELIPRASFTGLLQQYASTPELRQLLPDALQSLWHTMDTGGFSGDLRARLRRFNGQLFHEATTLPLTEPQIHLLLRAAAADWTEVEPAIFGTLLERALDPKERHSLGAHYTPRRYVERLVLPTVLEPLRREWAAAQAASARRLDETAGPAGERAARQDLLRFLTRLTTVKILDPACGSGNFLYVTLEHLKRLEGEVITAINRFGQSGLLDLGGATTVSPRQLLGLELNPRAAAIADVVLRIGYLQWHLRTHGLTQLAEPLLDSYQNIRQQDAVLSYEPDFTQAGPAAWPQADFIIGNPPFVGDKAMRRALGDAYVDTLRKVYKGKVDESADLVMYWWERAAETVRQGQAESFGFITTNSITQTFNRRLIQRHLDAAPPLSLTFAIADHPWVDSANGAAVRIAMSVGRAGTQVGKLATLVRESVTDEDDAHTVELVESEGIINADFTVGADVAGVKALKANEGVSSNGMMLAGAGFIVTEAQAHTLGLGTVAGLATRIRPYRNGKDLTARPRGVYLIDLFGLNEADVIRDYPAVYQHVYTHVKPDRDQNNRKKLKEIWWQFGETRKGLRAATQGLTRYIATPETAKHRIFQFLDVDIAPDHKLVNIAFDDAYNLGVLSSRIHVEWAMASGSWLGVGNDSVYTSSRCFQPFPFPKATVEQQERIRALAEALDAHRKRQQALHPTLALTDLYNVVEKLRAGQPLTAKEETVHQHGLAAVVLSLHQQLDTAVAEAYGWPTDLSAPELLQRLVHLNHQRAREEQGGHVRYLRPAYQAPETVQAGLILPAPTAAAKGNKATKLSDAAALPVNGVGEASNAWPQDLAQQMQALRTAIQLAEMPLTAAQVAKRFRGAGPARVQPLLDTLVTLGLVRHLIEEDAYAA